MHEALVNEKKQKPISDILVLKAKEQVFAIAISDVIEVIPEQPIAKLPMDLPMISGLFRWRDTAYPLIRFITTDDEKAFKPNQDARFILVKHHESSFAFLIDEVQGLFSNGQVDIIEFEEPNNNPLSIFSPLAVKVEGRCISLLDIEKLHQHLTLQASEME